MATTYEIRSKKDFDQKVDESSDPMILVFYNNASDSIADDKCGLIQGEIDSMGEAISVYKINLSTVALPAGIRQKYMAGNDLVCCVSKADSIKKRVVNPNQPEVMGLINSV